MKVSRLKPIFFWVSVFMPCSSQSFRLVNCMPSTSRKTSNRSFRLIASIVMDPMSRRVNSDWIDWLPCFPAGTPASLRSCQENQTRVFC